MYSHHKRNGMPTTLHELPGKEPRYATSRDPMNHQHSSTYSVQSSNWNTLMESHSDYKQLDGLKYNYNNYMSTLLHSSRMQATTRVSEIPSLFLKYPMNYSLHLLSNPLHSNQYSSCGLKSASMCMSILNHMVSSISGNQLAPIPITVVTYLKPPLKQWINYSSKTRYLNSTHVCTVLPIKLQYWWHQQNELTQFNWNHSMESLKSLSSMGILHHSSRVLLVILVRHWSLQPMRINAI